MAKPDVCLTHCLFAIKNYILSSIMMFFWTENGRILKEKSFFGVVQILTKSASMRIWFLYSAFPRMIDCSFKIRMGKSWIGWGLWGVSQLLIRYSWLRLEILYLTLYFTLNLKTCILTIQNVQPRMFLKITAVSCGFTMLKR